MDQVKAMRAFQRIAQAKSLSAAAQSLDTTHSSLSRQLQALEKSLGAQLVRRDTRGITLTEAGSRYYAACADIFRGSMPRRRMSRPMARRPRAR